MKRICESCAALSFAAEWTELLIGWLERRAALGAQVGTSHPTIPAYRTFGYRRQATVLAEFAPGALTVVRIAVLGRRPAPD